MSMLNPSWRPAKQTMSANLFFVPNSGTNQKEKELVDSSIRAHNMRVIHQKRRKVRQSLNQVRDKEGNIKRTMFTSEQSRDRNLSSTFSETRVLSDEALPLPATNQSAPSSTFGSDLSSPKIESIIRFVRFHLTRSWSPTFLLRLRKLNGITQTSPSSFELEATQWLWQLWTSNASLFWSVLASVLPTMSRDLPHEQRADLQAIATELKSGSFKNLRVTIQNMDNTDIPYSELLPTAYHIKALFREACSSADLEAATHHAEALSSLVDRLTQAHSSVETRRLALWGDALPALLQLRRPIVDFSITMAAVIDKIESAAETLLSDLASVDFELSSCVLIETSSLAFRFLQRAHHILAHPFLTRRETCRVDEVLFQWFTSTAEHHICRLLDMYYDLLQNVPPTDSKELLSEGERYMQASIALSLLYVYQKSFFDIHNDDGTDLNESAGLILPALHCSYENAERYCSRSEWLFYQEASLWITYIGSYAEKNLANNSRYSDYVTVREDWFSARLTQITPGLGTRDWRHAREALYKFCMPDFLYGESGGLC